jgi:hypothetical protein
MANEYLQRTPTSTGNQRVFTISVWIKRSASGSFGIFGAGDSAGATNSDHLWLSSDVLAFSAQDGTNFATSTPVLRDVGSWTHYHYIHKTEDAVAANRGQFFINGVRLRDASSSTFSINQVISWMNKAGAAHAVGARNRATFQTFMTGEMVDFFFVDGQALTPDVFGFYKQGKGYISVGSTQATDFRPGQWLPKRPRVITTEINRRGGFGVNGFYLPMNDSKNFGADFHCDPNSIITLNEKLPQPRVGVATTATVGLGFTDVLRTDPYAANLVLALPFVSSGLCTNGTNSGINTGFGDYSAVIKGSGTSKSATLFNNVSIATTASYYGSAVGFTSTSSQYLTIPNAGDFDFGSGDFTIEYWAYDRTVTGERRTLYLYNSAAEWLVGHSSQTVFFAAYDSSGNLFGQPTTGNVLTIGQWNHIAVEKYKTNLTIYVNGVAGAISTTYTGTIRSGQTPLYIGYDPIAASRYFDGYLQDLRIYKGVAKYKGGFDVPRPYTPVGIATWRAVPDTTANNFVTLNPLANGNAVNTVQISYTNGNNTATWSATSQNNATFGTVGINTGKWYWEGRLSTVGGNLPFIGISSQVGVSSCIAISNNGIAAGNSGVSFGNGGISAGDIVGVAVSFTTAGVGSTVTFFLNGTAVTNVSLIAKRDLFDGQTNTWLPSVSGVNGCVWDFNFGQNPTFSGNTTAGTFTDANGKGLFKYQPPSGFLSLCSANLPTPAISDPGKYFKTVLWTGDGNSGRSIVGVGFTPDLIWTKSRSNAYSHKLYDSVRGFPNQLGSDSTGSEVSGYLNSANSDGFSLSNDAGVNGSGSTFVAWCWRAGAGTTSTNTDGSITSVVSVNQTAGFSIVSYTGNGNASATVGHGLGKTPAMIIHKNRDGANSWLTLHKSIATPNPFTSTTWAVGSLTGGAIELNLTVAGGTYTMDAQTNGNGARYIAYCWAEIEGFSKIGSWIGNGSTDGPFVYCGFKPAFVLWKNASNATGYSWYIADNTRSSTNPVGSTFAPNTANIEDGAWGSGIMDFTSNGFKIRRSPADTNTSGDTFIFTAFAESPFTTANSK